ncbi:ABC transporter substrate-binding protein [Pararhizobium sp. A13]|uniref:ABC transporter substrate-binding protein n=1 Tax=Pararhizobium sp. A13 TaxID=3133975 RepID=UPI00311B2669
MLRIATRALTLLFLGRPRFKALRLLPLFAAAFFLAVAPARAKIVLTDLKGRTVALEKPASRLLVDDGRMILALSFLTDDPVGILAAWPHDVDRFGRGLYEAYRQKFPHIETLPKSSSNAQDLFVEQVLAAKPDLVVLSIFSHPAEQQIAQLAEAGIAVVFVDFVADPFDNTDTSLAILGEAIGKQDQAAKVVAFRKAQKKLISDRLADNRPANRPVVFLEAHASTSEPCCNSPGTGNIGRFIDFLGARNIGDVLKGRPFGQINLEYAVASRPGVYIASGGEYMAERNGLLIGPAYDKAKTAETLQLLLDRTGFQQLPAVKNGNVHGISQQVFNSPLDLLALELVAKWVHPRLFADLDIEETRRVLNGMMAIPLTGNYWTD